MTSCLLTTLFRNRWRIGILTAFLALAIWSLILQLNPLEATTTAPGAIDLPKFLQATESPEAAASEELGTYRYPDPGTMLPDQQPLWPIYSFLWAEIYRCRGDTTQACKIYRHLAEWAEKNPYGDEWGGSGLAFVSLWRWLSLVNANAPSTDIERQYLLDMIQKFWPDRPRLARGMCQSLYWASALPQLQENFLRQTSFLARRLNQPQAAQRFFIEYLSYATTGQFTQEEEALLAKATSEGILSMPKIALTLGARLEKLGDFDGASRWLTKAMETGKSQIRAEASLSLARLRRLDKQKPEPCLTDNVRRLLAAAINDSTDPEVIQEALFLRAQIAIREGCSKDYALFQKDLRQIIKDFRQGRRADSALNQLASYHLDRYRDLEEPKDLEMGLQLFAQLRQDYRYREGFIDSSWFKPAMALYTRGGPAGLQQAATLLRELEKARPHGPMHLAALFWLGRIAEESDRAEESKKYFNTIINESPYNYYATRSRMHLNLGKRAARQSDPDDKTMEALHAAYQYSQTQRPSPTGNSAYHRRLQAAVQSGLYYRSLRSYIDFRHQEFPSSRLESIPLDGLDQAHRLSGIVLLLALRQDALAAADTPPTAANRLAVAKTLSEFNSPTWPFGDWPLVIYLTGAADQNDPGYLAVAFPKTYKALIDKYSAADLPGAFLYAVIRHESAFETTALSPAGALGLLQFMPRTFNVLNSRYKVLKKKGKTSREEFLLNAEDSIYLGALWFRKELFPRQDDDFLYALMEHNAGLPAVREWKRKWQRWGKLGDYEFMIETVRFAETRTFVRAVANTYWIVQAAGIY